MAYLANAGFDVFSMDMTGYGRSTRPTAMNDPCNLSPAQQAQFVPRLIAAPCPPSYPGPIDDDRLRLERHRRRRRPLRALRHVERVNLVGVVAGRTARGRLCGAASARRCSGSCCSRRPTTATGADARAGRCRPTASVFNTQSHDGVRRELGSPGRLSGSVRPAASDVVWSDMLASDPVGATWGAGVRRAPQVTELGMEHRTSSSKTQMPTLMVDGRARQAGAARRACRSSTTISASPTRSSSTSLLVAQRDVGEESSAAVPGVARMAPGGHRQRREDRHAEDRLRPGSEECGLGSRWLVAAAALVSTMNAAPAAPKNGAACTSSTVASSKVWASTCSASSPAKYRSAISSCLAISSSTRRVR